MRVTSALLSFLATAALASAGRWSFTAYTETDCKGSSPVGRGDSKAYGCNNFNSKQTLKSVSGDVVDGFEIALYPEDNCGGNHEQYIRSTGTCSSAGRGDFQQIKSFKVNSVKKLFHAYNL